LGAGCLATPSSNKSIADVAKTETDKATNQRASSWDVTPSLTVTGWQAPLSFAWMRVTKMWIGPIHWGRLCCACKSPLAVSLIVLCAICAMWLIERSNVVPIVLSILSLTLLSISTHPGLDMDMMARTLNGSIPLHLDMWHGLISPLPSMNAPVNSAVLVPAVPVLGECSLSWLAFVWIQHIDCVSSCRRRKEAKMGPNESE
jgi:hypothetical protein